MNDGSTAESVFDFNATIDDGMPNEIRPEKINALENRFYCAPSQVLKFISRRVKELPSPSGPLISHYDKRKSLAADLLGESTFSSTRAPEITTQARHF